MARGSPLTTSEMERSHRPYFPVEFLLSELPNLRSPSPSHDERSRGEDGRGTNKLRLVLPFRPLIGCLRA